MSAANMVPILYWRSVTLCFVDVFGFLDLDLVSGLCTSADQVHPLTNKMSDPATDLSQSVKAMDIKDKVGI